MKIHAIALGIFIFLPFFSNAQSINKAKKEMERYNYAEAIQELTKVSDDKKSKNEAISLLAECYRLQHDIINARLAYSQAVTLPDAKPEYYLYYAQMLQSTGEYTAARDMFLKYAEKKPTDARGKLFVTHCDSVLGSWKNIVPRFEAKLANIINTEQSDFGPAFYNGSLVFVSDFNPAPTDDKQYGWTGRGYLNIMKTQPLKAGDYWGNLDDATEFVSTFNQEYHDGPASFTADGNTIYFTRSFYGKAKREGIFKTNQLNIYYASRSGQGWGEIKPFVLNNTDYSVGHPAISADGKTLYFVSNMPGGQGKTDIWKCDFINNEWGPAINLGPSVNTSENEMFPSLSSDGNLYFASDGHAGYGALDLFKTRYQNGEWTTPENLHPPLNGSYDDFAIAFEEGKESGFFSSNRPDGMGSDDIYSFRIPPTPPVEPSFISGIVKDKQTLLPVAGATVFVVNPLSGKVTILKTGADGIYKTRVLNPAQYTVKAMMPNYIADCTPFPVISLLPGITSMAPRELLLDKLVVNKTFKIDNIYYDFDKFEIREDAKPELDKLVLILKENLITVELGSHTDSRGSLDYNDKLSQNRAESAVEYIIASGIDKNRITAKGYGERQLTNKCADGIKCNAQEHQANRRTEFKVTGFAEPSGSSDWFEFNKFTAGDEIDQKLLPVDFLLQCK